MKPFIYIILAFLSVSCWKLNQDENYVRLTGSVEISHTQIPDTVDNMGFAQIKAQARAINGCWSNLNFLLTRTDEFDYSLQAFGIYESYGTCPDVMVYGDTIITIQPTRAGLYKFYIYKGPNDVDIDTMIVR